jgi:hypothetical protein
MTWKVIAVDPAGNATMTQTIDRMRIKGVTPDGVMEADSQGNKISPALAPSLGPVFKAIVGGKFKLKMTPSGRIKDVEIPAGALEDANNPAAMGGMLSADSLKEMTTQSTIPLPNGPVEPGDGWTDEKNLAGAKILMRYTYDGSVDLDGQDLEKISTAANITLDSQEAQGFKTEMEKGDLKGEVLFDSDRGVLVSSQAKQEMVLSITGQGQSLRQEVQSLVELKLVPPGGVEKPNTTPGKAKSKPAN